MKHRLTIGLLVGAWLALSMTATPALGPFGKKSSNGDDPAAMAEEFLGFVKLGTVNFLKALREAALAVKDEELAETIETKLGECEKLDKGKGWRECVDGITDVPITIERFKAAKGQAQEHVVGSFIHFTLGSAFDRQAIKAGNALIESKPSGMALMKGNVRRGVKMATEAVKTLPDHVKLSGQWIKAFTDYMRTNNIRIPSKRRIRDAAEDSGATPDQVNTAFPV